MAINPAGGAQIALSVFGGLVSEMAPPDLPEGVSPACNDVVFAPGSVASRPGLKRVFPLAIPGNPTVTYAKSFVTPTGQIENLYFTSDGTLWWEDLTNNPGIYTQLALSTPGAWAKSCTAFGREYIAISDKLHGAEVPLQWDGTHLDRVTQDGPGSPPTVASIALPPVGLAVIGGSGPTVTSITTTDLVNGYYTTLTIVFSGAVSLPIGTPITVSGNTNANFNGYLSGVSTIVSSTTVKLGGFFFSTLQTGTGGVATGTGAVTMARANNIVTVGCAAPHNLQVGYQAQIAGPPAAVFGSANWNNGASVSSIVINNESLPGIATVNTSAAHGLIPGVFVILSGVQQITVGTAISSAAWAGGLVTVTTTTAHGLVPGAFVTINATGGGAAAFNVTAAVLSVISSTIFTYALTPLAAPANATGGTVSLTWPIPNSPTPTYFEVSAAPSPTSFQVQINYADGTWTTGTLQFPWDGTFFVSAVLSATQFQYQQNGPPASTASTSGTVTPWGQAAPGPHQLSVLFLTRQGYITRPSPPVTVTANGGQYFSVTNIPIGPANVVARILAFSGAYGSLLFYIPTPPQINGQLVATATQINDNVTTAVTLDFSDNTLFASLGISIPGNNLANQMILDGALGFGFYGSRLITWGQRNRIQNLLNMGFDGGALPSTPTMPTGWTYVGPTQGFLDTGNYGGAWNINVVGGPVGQLSQSMYEDAYGVPIAQSNQQYTLRAWLNTSSADPAMSFKASITSASTGFSSSAVITGDKMTVGGSFLQAAFSAAMPAAIPSDLILTISASTTGFHLTLVIDELSIIYSQTPYLDGVFFGSYVDNPEAFDGVTGKFGPSEDSHKVMDFAVIRQTMVFLTQDPSGRLHEVADNGLTEPSGWQVQEVASNCGLLSAFALTKSQADDSSGSGGEEWMAWASWGGARIFGGGQPDKISQEIEPDWAGAANAGASQWSTAPGISPTYQTAAWALNDPRARVIYFGLPLATGPQGAAQIIYTMNYRELDTAQQIAASGPIRTSYTGRLIATDHTRKWAPWFLAINGAALMYRQAGTLSVVLFGGNGATPGTVNGFGNVYTLDPTKLTDDDYGQISPAYTTFFVPSSDQEERLSWMGADGKRAPLGAGLKILQYLSAFVAGVGNLTVSYFSNSLANAWPLKTTRALLAAPTDEMECGGGMAKGNRIAIRFSSSPITGTDNSFNLQKVTATVKPAIHTPVRGAA